MNLNNFVLFSPIGNHDPIGGVHDGAMLHIVRNYKPRKVYLYYTQEIYEIDKEGSRSKEALRRLFPEIQIEDILESGSREESQPHNFDAFMDTFSTEINRIIEENPNDEVLLNVTSGTPQMMATLCLVSVTSSRPPKIIQVTNPEKRSNTKRRFSDDEFKMMLEGNMDNATTSENRCTEPQIMSFRDSMLKSQIKSLVEIYDYEGASRLTKDLNNDTLRLLVENCRLRFLLKGEESKDTIREYDGVDLFPVEEQDVMEITEYFSMLKIKQKRGLITDFVIGLNPFVTEMLTCYLKEYLSVDIDRFNSIWKNGRVVVRRKKIAEHEPELLEALDKNEKFKTGFVDSDVSIIYLHEAAKYYSKNNYSEDIEFFSLLEKLNSRKRNETAHNLVAITDADVVETVLTTSEVIIRRLEEIMIRIFGDRITPEIFNIYEILNNAIIKELDRY